MNGRGALTKSSIFNDIPNNNSRSVIEIEELSIISANYYSLEHLSLDYYQCYNVYSIQTLL